MDRRVGKPRRSFCRCARWSSATGCARLELSWTSAPVGNGPATTAVSVGETIHGPGRQSVRTFFLERSLRDKGESRLFADKQPQRSRLYPCPFSAIRGTRSWHTVRKLIRRIVSLGMRADLQRLSFVQTVGFLQLAILADGHGFAGGGGRVTAVSHSIFIGHRLVRGVGRS